ncbi:MAG TPA: N-methyl-L-tryptophan oxidase [Gemmatimonadaceae bacterium]|nr:N-methyl-L-tryptophan oxidase [Gemmatimonadaceae bacterium]
MFDTIVAGLGAVGSAAAFRLASRGNRVLDLDRFAPPHALGSSHGKSRIIREAYFENPLYVPLVQRSYECWTEIEALAGRQLYTRTGGLMIGPPDGTVVAGARSSALTHDLPFEKLSAKELQLRVPAFRPSAGTVAIWEPRAGILAPEAAIEAHLALARASGAELRFDEPMLSWRATRDQVEVATPKGTVRAGELVIAAGAWARDLLSDLALPLTVERNVVYWFNPASPTQSFSPERFPIFIHEFAPGRAWYGFPDVGDGVKVALHHQGESTHPDSVRRTVGDEEIAVLRALLERYIPEANGPLRETAICMYTNTPDEHFIIDRHPAYPQILVASPCSGHGFKFASAIGEVIADLVTGRTSRFDLRPFSLSRLRRAGAGSA